MKTESWRWAKPEGALQKGHYCNGAMIEGAVFTSKGIVCCYSEDFDGPGYTSMYFVYGSRCWHRTWDKFYSKRYLVTLANRFAKEIAEEE